MSSLEVSSSTQVDLIALSLELIENQKYSELGLLLQQKSVSAKGSFYGRVIQHVVESLVDGHVRVQCMLKVLTQQALLSHFEIQRRLFSEPSPDLLRQEQRAIRQSMSSEGMVDKFGTMILIHSKELIKTLEIENEEIRLIVTDSLIGAQSRTMESFNKVFKAEIEVRKASSFDIYIFTECIKQVG